MKALLDSLRPGDKDWDLARAIDWQTARTHRHHHGRQRALGRAPPPAACGGRPSARCRP